ncbi:hypothetical protein DFJ74DRAFT_320520 [Hyaloraphidium curvatum]|nr:hypothetical protein DFJ74DRAFT_320520 [Hyaloraphidium curvatum]
MPRARDCATSAAVSLLRRVGTTSAARRVAARERKAGLHGSTFVRQIRSPAFQTSGGTSGAPWPPRKPHLRQCFQSSAAIRPEPVRETMPDGDAAVDGRSGTAAQPALAKTTNGHADSTLRKSFIDLPVIDGFTKELPGDEVGNKYDKDHPIKRTSRQVHKGFFTHVHPLATPSPFLVSASDAALAELDLPSRDELLTSQPDFADFIAGNKLVPGTDPWAQAYAGHQFGVFAGQLGDGRAISLLQTTGKGGRMWEVQLKGAGRTPYSRFADGYAVLRSTIREYICSEFMARVGVPTTRAVGMVVTPNRPVMREQGLEMGAIVMRMAESWVRVGTLELPMMREWKEGTKLVCEYVVRNYLPEIWEKHGGQATSDLYLDLFRVSVQRNAETVAHWQALGFVHGVLNTDNTSVLGLTLDYGPYGFLDDYDPSWTPNTTDEDGRYCFGNQPGIILWNLARMARCFIDVLVDESKDSKEETQRVGRELKEVLDKFVPTFLAEWVNLMRQKLGLKTSQEDDADTLVHPLLEVLQTSSMDYTLFFRTLSSYSVASPSVTKDVLVSLVRDSFTSKSFKRAFRKPEPGEKPPTADSIAEDLEAWFGSYHNRLLEEVGSDLSPEALAEGDRDRKTRMWAANPKWVPRQWIMQDVIETCSKSPICKVPELANFTSSDNPPAPEDVPPPAVEADENVLAVDRAMRVLCGDTYGEVSDAEEWERLLGHKKETNSFAKGWGLEEWMLVEKWGGEPPKLRNFQCSCSS